MKRKNILKAFVLLLVITSLLTGCAPKRNIKGLQKHFVETGYIDENFIALDNIVFKALLKIVGMKGVLAYNDGSSAFLVFEMKEPKSPDEIIDATISLLSQMDMSELADVPELSEAIKKMAESKEQAEQYLSVNTTFVLLHDNKNPQLVSTFMSY